LYTFTHRRVPPRSDSLHEPVYFLGYRENTPSLFSTTSGTRPDFRHALETGEKRVWPLEHEAETFVYLTGLFFRLAIQSGTESTS